MDIISLFDGMSCGQVAINRIGIKYDNYYASEIDKYATGVTQYNFKNTIQLGDILNWRQWNIDWSKIGLILAGSPCQGFSFAGNQLAFNDPRSKLFFVFIDIYEHIKKCNPDVVFLLENVRMKQEFQDVISKYLKVRPVSINSNLVSAQNRYRLYWTNIKNIDQPIDKNIFLKDIVHEQADTILTEKGIQYMLSGNEKWMQAGNCRLDRYLMYKEDKSFCVTANIRKGIPYNCFFNVLNEYIVPFNETLQILDKEVEKGKLGFFKKDSQGNRVYYIHGKSVTLTGSSGGSAAKMGQYLFGCITPDRINKRQNGQRFNDGQKFYTLTAQDKHGVLVEGYIRRLTPIECERLQTAKDNYTKNGIINNTIVEISNNQRYKMVGNGWTIDVIAHILSQFKK